MKSGEPNIGLQALEELTLLMRFISPRLETRTKESIRYASIRVDKTQECGMKVKDIEIRNCLRCEVLCGDWLLVKWRLMRMATSTDYNFTGKGCLQ